MKQVWTGTSHSIWSTIIREQLFVNLLLHFRLQISSKMQSSIVGVSKTISKSRARDLNSIDTPNRKAFLVRQSSREEPSSTVLGKGAFGVVLLATYRSTPVAVKLIKRCGTREERIPNEQNILGLEQQENIIRIIKITKELNHFLVIMERMTGNNLLFILNHTKEIQLSHQIRIILQVSRGLEFLHRNLVIHLDIKPSNILICPTPSPLVKLCDFGNSHRLKYANKSIVLKKLSGTVAFMAPEMLRKYSVSPAADVYALGITIWQVLHRRQPYAGISNEDQVIYRVVKNNLRPSDEEKEEEGRADETAMPLKSRSFKKLFMKSPTRNTLPQSINSVLPPDQQPVDEKTPLPTTEGLTWQNEESENSSNSHSEINWNEIFSVEHREQNNSITLSAVQDEYKDLYSKCWHRKPHQRPVINEIIGMLNHLLNRLLDK